MNIDKLKKRFEQAQILITIEIHQVSQQLNNYFKYATSSELAEDLERLMQGEFIEDSPLYINQRSALIHYYVDYISKVVEKIKKYDESKEKTDEPKVYEEVNPLILN